MTLPYSTPSYDCPIVQNNTGPYRKIHYPPAFVTANHVAIVVFKVADTSCDAVIRCINGLLWGQGRRHLSGTGDVLNVDVTINFDGWRWRGGRRRGRWWRCNIVMVLKLSKGISLYIIYYFETLKIH